jgi:integrase
LKLPNNYGSISKLSGKRRRPYVVRKSKEGGGSAIIGYAASREEGLAMLAAYNANPWDIDKAKITLQELFDLWKEKKAPKLGKSNRASLMSVFNYCTPLAGIPFRQIKAYQMQETIDTCGKSPSTQGAIKNLWGHLDRFSLELDISSSRYSELLTSEPIPETSRLPFTNEEIARLWDHQSEPWVDTVLIFIYSGWRISELLALTPEDIDLEAGTMKGGTKTKAGKGRIVPIHSKIRGFIETRLANNPPRLISHKDKPVSTTVYRALWASLMDNLEMQHTPHECRHTFETLLDAAGGNRRCIDLLMGHVSKDTGNRVYNHKTIDELKATVELIKV